MSETICMWCSRKRPQKLANRLPAAGHKATLQILSGLHTESNSADETFPCLLFYAMIIKSQRWYTSAGQRTAVNLQRRPLLGGGFVKAVMAVVFVPLN